MNRPAMNRRAFLAAVTALPLAAAAAPIRMDDDGLHMARYAQNLAAAAGIDPQVTQYLKMPLTSAQILALHVTPVELIPALLA